MKLSIYIGFFLILTNCNILNADLRYSPKSADEFYFATLSPEFEKVKNDCIEKREFPCNFPKPNDSLSELENQCYSKHLRSLKEPILYNKKNEGKKIIRFTLLGTWSHPVTYRIENKNEEIIGTFNKSFGRGGYKAGMRIKHIKKILSSDNWDRIITKIDSINFWNIQTQDPHMILDGAEWILEVLIDGKYHVVTRNCPDIYDGKEYADLCILIMNSFNE